MNNIKKIFFLINSSEKKIFILLIMLILIMALFEMIGVASIMPFIAILSNPSLVDTNIILNTIFQYSLKLGVDNKQEFLFFMGLIMFILLISSIILKGLTGFFQVRFITTLEYNISKRLVEEYLHQPYSWFLSRHSSDLSKNILSETNTVIGGYIQSIIDLIAKTVVAIAIIILLLIVNLNLALTIGSSLIFVYLFVIYFSRKYLKKIGAIRLKHNQLRFKAVNEAFGAVKAIKVGGLEKIYTNNFSKSAQIFAKTLASAQIIVQIPRLVIEAVAFGGIILMILYFIKEIGSFNYALPIISLYVLAGYRLLPALQQIYMSYSNMNFNRPAFDKLYTDLENLKHFNNTKDQESLIFNKTIVLKNIYYSYPDALRTALKDINLSFSVNSTIGLVGATGSGKTTTVDIILGLLEPQKGTLEVDGIIITEQNRRSWQKSIGYVPQHIFLSDDTIAANIAFGVETRDINQNLVEKASKIAELHQFIIDELPNQYQTKVGERGVRLSGGQRQRIGIARALYHNPKILILDEATNALDHQTEKAVMDAINNLNKKTTIILIAHRLNTVKNCDIIFKLDKGSVVKQGTFDQIIDNND